MYPDPKRVRDHRITTRLDDYEDLCWRAMCDQRGIQPATLLRDLAVLECGRWERLPERTQVSAANEPSMQDHA
ncbi:hypothetical protein [Pseudacidovorax intermedius]|uniref:Uncharacterized protein n=1 Tax=Pseudacidovorax intermedius TaxID=433924 RepID=A0A147H9T1_9BURK|nr:hypothetical protein [Pseudacidovorax intermedius]KTT26534.1 hypothetical protein NS331_03705 [Pseudacidovorax intermedius]